MQSSLRIYFATLAAYIQRIDLLQDSALCSQQDTDVSAWQKRFVRVCSLIETRYAHLAITDWLTWNYNAREQFLVEPWKALPILKECRLSDSAYLVSKPHSFIYFHCCYNLFTIIDCERLACMTGIIKITWEYMTMRYFSRDFPACNVSTSAILIRTYDLNGVWIIVLITRCNKIRRS